ncbi:hypothetical protein PRIPAC_83652, partial [Pristionchus pacificus]|uniref:Uncharacterized protein n=1 Tax=Pristionchus pacificus TaxID=54126 RepID=A0A2A6BSL5_PRIPA
MESLKVHSLLQDGHFIQWMFDGCMARDIDIHRDYSSMLVFLLGRATFHDECKSLIIRFYPQLCAVLSTINHRRLRIYKREVDSSPSTFRHLAVFPEIAGVLETMPSLFRDWYCEWWSKECDQKMCNDLLLIGDPRHRAERIL